MTDRHWHTVARVVDHRATESGGRACTEWCQCGAFRTVDFGKDGNADFIGSWNEPIVFTGTTTNRRS